MRDSVIHFRWLVTTGETNRIWSSRRTATERFSAVMNKLSREPRMKLSQMQDLGGCREILSTVKAVGRLNELYQEEDRPLLLGTEGSLKCYDYIREPKSDGYRCIHLIGRYLARDQVHEPWNREHMQRQDTEESVSAFGVAANVRPFLSYSQAGRGDADTVRSFTRWM